MAGSPAVVTRRSPDRLACLVHDQHAGGGAIAFSWEGRSTACAEFAGHYPQFEWVVFQEPGTQGTSTNMPSEPHLPAFTRMVRADARYRLLLEFAVGNGKKVWVFGR